MTRSDDIREQQRDTWDRFSSGWDKWDEIVLGMIRPVGDEMLRLLDVRTDSVVLDVASGTGEPGLTIAELAPSGRVVLTDPAAGMVTVAERNAGTRGLSNVEFRVCGADDLAFEDATFDRVSCRFGFMFFPDLAAAAREMRRVLRPGGRICTAVWAGPEGNPWATIPMAEIAREVDLPAPDPDAPGLFRCAVPGSISELFRDAGFTDVVETDVRGALVTDSADLYWDYMTEIAAPVVAGLALADDAARARIRDAVVAAVGARAVDGRPTLDLHARCIAATG